MINALTQSKQNVQVISPESNPSSMNSDPGMSREMTEDYREGLRDGEIHAIKEMQKSQNNRLDDHDKRLSVLERVTYMVLGMIVLLEFLPTIKTVLGQ